MWSHIKFIRRYPYVAGKGSYTLDITIQIAREFDHFLYLRYCGKLPAMRRPEKERRFRRRFFHFCIRIADLFFSQDFRSILTTVYGKNGADIYAMILGKVAITIKDLGDTAAQVHTEKVSWGDMALDINADTLLTEFVALTTTGRCQLQRTLKILSHEFIHTLDSSKIQVANNQSMANYYTLPSYVFVSLLMHKIRAEGLANIMEYSRAQAITIKTTYPKVLSRAFIMIIRQPEKRVELVEFFGKEGVYEIGVYYVFFTLLSLCSERSCVILEAGKHTGSTADVAEFVGRFNKFTVRGLPASLFSRYKDLLGYDVEDFLCRRQTRFTSSA